MKVKIKKLTQDAIIPTYGSEGAACFDFYASEIKGQDSDSTTYGTGVAVEVPHGHVLLLLSRSGHGFKSRLSLANRTGVIDADYRGEIMVKLVREGGSAAFPVVGERVCQGLIIPYPSITFEEVDALSETERGVGGFGSTGN